MFTRHGGGAMWFQESWRRLLVDMHIPDWDESFMSRFSAEEYAEMMALAKVDTAEIYAGSCLGLCYWPTKVGYQHRQLKGRDLLAETVFACQKRGIRVQIYLNVWNRAAHDAHPDWRIIAHDGKGTVEHTNSRFGLCCINTPYRGFFLDLLSELVDAYPCAGYWIDMIGHWYHCYCPACAARFKKESGFDPLPRLADWQNPAWLAWQNCRRNWLDEFAQQVNSVVKQQFPERTVTLQTASFTRGRDSGVGPGFLDASDYLAGDFTGDSIQQSDICKLFGAFSRFRPMEFMTPRCENLLHHTTERSFSNLLMRAYAAIANQASFTLIDAIDPDGTLDRRFYENARKIFSAYEVYEKYLSGGSVPLTDLAIYYSRESQFDVEMPPKPLQDFASHPAAFASRRRNMVLAFQREHLLFTYVGGKAQENLQRHPLIVISDSSALSDQECAALEQYVANGGKIYASMHTSLKQSDPAEQPDFRLAGLFGIHYTGRKTAPVTYLAPVQEGTLPGATARYPVMLDSGQLLVKADADVEVLATLTMPCSGADEQFHFGSAISNPPMHPTSAPALVYHRYGKGEVIYAAGRLEEVPFDCQRRVFLSLIRRLRQQPLVESNAPGTVEITIFEQPEDQRLVVSLLNLPAELPPAPLYNLTVRLHLPSRLTVSQAFIAPEDCPFPFARISDSALEFHIEQLNEFMLFTLACTGEKG